MCTHNTCTRGHNWPAELASASCPDCQTPNLAVKLVNCPVCNEPPAFITITVQHLSTGMRLLPPCNAGTESRAETFTVKLTPKRWHELTDQQLVLPFEDPNGSN